MMGGSVGEDVGCCLCGWNPRECSIEQVAQTAFLFAGDARNAATVIGGLEVWSSHVI